MMKKAFYQENNVIEVYHKPTLRSNLVWIIFASTSFQHRLGLSQIFGPSRALVKKVRQTKLRMTCRRRSHQESDTHPTALPT